MDVDVMEVAAGVFQARAKHVGWVLVVDGDEVTLVDTGYPGDRDRVVASLARIGRSPADVAAVVLTHAHPDHLGSAEYFRTVVGKPVLAHELEVPNATGARIEQVSIPTLLTMAWRSDVLVWAMDVIRLKGAKVDRLGDVQTFGTGPLDVPGRPVPVHTPGHTSGHCAMHLPERGVLLAGDALMTDHALSHASGPQLLPGFFNHDNAQARESLALIADLEADVVIPGHGPVFRGTPAQAVHAALAAVPEPLAPGMDRISYGAIVPLPPAEVFAFVSDPRHWHLFFDSVRSAEADADWGAVGGHARLTNVDPGPDHRVRTRAHGVGPAARIPVHRTSTGAPGHGQPQGVRTAARRDPVAGHHRVPVARRRGQTDRPGARPGAATDLQHGDGQASAGSRQPLRPRVAVGGECDGRRTLRM